MKLACFITFRSQGLLQKYKSLFWKKSLQKYKGDSLLN